MFKGIKQITTTFHPLITFLKAIRKFRERRHRFFNKHEMHDNYHIYFELDNSRAINCRKFLVEFYAHSDPQGHQEDIILY